MVERISDESKCYIITNKKKVCRIYGLYTSKGIHPNAATIIMAWNLKIRTVFPRTLRKIEIVDQDGLVLNLKLGDHDGLVLNLK